MQDFVNNMNERIELLRLVDTILFLSQKTDEELAREREQDIRTITKLQSGENKEQRAKAAIAKLDVLQIVRLLALPQEIQDTVTDYFALLKGRMSNEMRVLLRMYYGERRREANEYMEETNGVYTF